MVQNPPDEEPGRSATLLASSQHAGIRRLRLAAGQGRAMGWLTTNNGIGWALPMDGRLFVSSVVLWQPTLYQTARMPRY